jgi:hypothetical protein
MTDPRTTEQDAAARERDAELIAIRMLGEAWRSVPAEARGRVLDWFAAYALDVPAAWISTEPPRNDY